MYYLLLYDVVDRFAERRTTYRDAHLKQARAAASNGELLLAGAFSDPVDGAALVFEAADSRSPSDSRRTIPMSPQDS